METNLCIPQGYRLVGILLVRLESDYSLISVAHQIWGNVLVVLLPFATVVAERLCFHKRLPFFPRGGEVYTPLARHPPQPDRTPLGKHPNWAVFTRLPFPEAATAAGRVRILLE